MVASKGSARQTTQANRQTRLLGRVKDLFGQAKSFRWSSAEMLDRRNTELFASNDWQRATVAMREYLRGHYDCLWDGLYRTEFEFKFSFEGVLWTWEDLAKVLDERNVSREDRQKAMESGQYYWKGTDKAW